MTEESQKMLEKPGKVIKTFIYSDEFNVSSDLIQEAIDFGDEESRTKNPGDYMKIKIQRLSFLVSSNISSQ